MEPDGYLAPSGSRSAGYTNGMKTAISVPDSLFNQAEELARRTGKSRSQIYQEALKEYLLRRDLGAVTEAMDRALAEIDQVSDPWFSQASRQALERSEW
jgi:predicted transcriptional regulator